MTLLLVVGGLVLWAFVAVLVVALCVQARRGDEQLSGASTAKAREPLTRRPRSASDPRDRLRLVG